MSSFDFFWQLMETHGVIPSMRAQSKDLWDSLSLNVQRQVYRTIRDKIQNGKFVNYNPIIAIKNNLPAAPRTQVISSQEYYRRYGTQANLDGWVRTFLPEQQKTIYIKQLKN